jgi:AraC family transcriptional regulator
MELFDVHILYKSDFYQIRSFKCNFLGAYTSNVEVNQSFRLCFMRSGYFEYHVFHKELEVHVGRLLVSKPLKEYRIRLIKPHPDVSTIISFTSHFYNLLKENYQVEAGWFFNNVDLNSMLIPCSAELDHLHHLIYLQSLKAFPDPMLIDDWVISLVDKVMRILGNRPFLDPLPSGLKKNHLVTIDKAKEFIIENSGENISLQRIADHCCVSIFHFCRIFKSIMGISPYQYLNEIRLSNARILLLESKLPITQLAFQCGFNSLAQFDSAFRSRFQISPTAYKKGHLPKIARIHKS